MKHKNYHTIGTVLKKTLIEIVETMLKSIYLT